jgi:hypothetical protein
VLWSLVSLVVALVAAWRLRGGALALVAVAVAVVLLVTWRENRRVSNRAARLLPFGRRGRRAQQLRAVESLAALAGAALLLWSFFD